MIRRFIIAIGIAFTLAMLRSTAHAAPPAEGPVYVVQSGDTLTAIAKRSGTTIAALMQANGLKNQDQVLAGQKLVIPGQTAAPQANPAAPQAKVAAPAPSVATNPAPSAAAPTDSLSVVTSGAPPVAAPTTGRWIYVSLGKQRLTAYEGNAPVYSTLVSTGTKAYPTVVGTFRVYTKIKSQRMTGPGYSLPNVPNVMYFIGGYAIHGAYWHNNFGRPMSHGCVNLPLPAAAWMFNWASVGTPVVVTR